MDLSIIIVSWNTRELLEACLSSIYNNPPDGEFEVWIVDNASTDDTVTVVKSKFAQIKLIQNEINQGFASANNQAIKECTGKYILFLNPDTEIRGDTLNVLMHYLDEHPRTGGVGPKLLNPDGTLQVSCYPAPTLFREFSRLFYVKRISALGGYDMHCWDPDLDRNVEVIQGACLLLRKQVFDQVGLLDNKYFMYTEEVDLCFRLRKAGWELYWIPSAEVVHYGGQSTQQVASKMFANLYLSKIQYFQKNHGSISASVYKLLLIVASLVRVCLSPLVWLEKPVRREEHLQLARNYLNLFLDLSGRSG
jgi:GT2 family glycosyltransferase